jgi:microcin C transport system substrate-binding protein
MFLPIALLCGCGEEEERVQKGLGFEEFVPKYNRYIRNWLKDQQAKVDGELAEVEAKYEAAGEEEKAALEDELADARRQVERIKFRQGLGDYFAFKSIDDLPEGLTWETGMDEPEIGDPRAKKGGTFNYYIANFPPTLRPFGPEANNSFRGELYDNIEMGQTGLHPDTLQPIPGLAKEWSISEDNRTVYYKLHPEAKYNDGVPVKARDFMISAYLRVSDDITAPYPKQYFREQFGQWVVYDDMTFAVTLADARPRSLVPYYTSIAPCAPHFYDEYGPDYEERYNWRVPPTTAPYFVKDEDIVKGASMTLTRATDWWAKDMKYYRYRFNTDRIVYRVIRDRSKAWELFRAGELDFFMITTPQDWYQKSEIPPVFDGYIERYQFYNQFPRPPWGLYLNTAKPPLDDRNVRLGIHHAMNWDKVLDVIFWGDYGRLPGMVSGYGDLVNPNVQARDFSPAEARKYFAQAGFTEEGADGILRKPGGQRLQATLSFPTNNPIVGNMAGILKEEAKKGGMDLVLDGIEHTVLFKKEMKKEHEIAFSAWNFQPPFPRFYEYLHSRFAYDEKGNLKQQTNNVFSYRNPEVDKLVVAYRKAETWDEKRELGLKIQQIVHDEALFVPGYQREFERVGCWRWLRWPDSEETRFCPRLTSYPYESYVYWVDEEMKRETREAMKRGETFPEVQRVFDDYRVTREKGGGDE